AHSCPVWRSHRAGLACGSGLARESSARRQTCSRASPLPPWVQPSPLPWREAVLTMHLHLPGLARRLPWLVLALLAAFPLVAPAFGFEYYVGFVRRVLIVAIAATSLNFILGYGGMAALGHAGFIGVG